ISVYNGTNCEDAWLGQQSNPKIDPKNKAWLGHEFDSAKDAGYVKTFIERDMCAYDPENICQGGAHGSLSFATPDPKDPTVTAVLGTATPGASSSPSPTPAPPAAVPSVPSAPLVIAPTATSTP